jgi:hypothetical protein
LSIYWGTLFMVYDNLKLKTESKYNIVPLFLPRSFSIFYLHSLLLSMIILLPNE